MGGWGDGGLIAENWEGGGLQWYSRFITVFVWGFFSIALGPFASLHCDQSNNPVTVAQRVEVHIKIPGIQVRRLDD